MVDFAKMSANKKAAKLPDNQLRLPSGKIITLNKEQYQGIGKIKVWLKSRDGRFFTLAGYAGTGKSTIVKKIIDDYKYGVVVSAPTHQAKKIIRNATGVEAVTLHGLLGLRPDLLLESFDPNQPQFNPIAIPKIANYNCVIIDEVSMINKELYDLIVEKTENTRTKVLFVGDPAQIPPIGEKESYVFNKTDKDFHQLTKVERQNDTNPLSIIYDALRNNLNKLDGGFKRITNMNDLGEGAVFTIDKRTFRKAVLEKYRDAEFKKDTDFCKVIAWKNDTVMQGNLVIREQLLGKNTDIVEVDDLLKGYRSIMDEKQRYNIIENSGDYLVVEKSALEENAHGITGYRVKLRENLSKGKYHYQDIFIVDSTDHNNLHLYAEMHDFFKDMSKSDRRNWKKYYGFRRDNVLMTDIDKYRNGLYRPSGEGIVRDLDYGYVITCHKSQGSTYTHVFILENDINDNWVLKERNQIKYVSFTRPTTSATILCTKIDE